MSPHKVGSRKRRRVLPIILALLALLIIGSGVLVGYVAAYAQRFPPGMRIGGIPVGGLNYLEALKRTEEQTEAFFEAGLTFTLDRRKVPVGPTVGSGDEFSYDIYDIDPEASVQRAFASVQTASWPLRLGRMIQSATLGRSAPLVITFDDAALTKTLKENFGRDEQPAVNARLRVKDKTLTLSVEAERAGFRFDYAAAVKVAKQRVAALGQEPTPLQQVVDQPTVTASEATALLPQAQAAITRAPFTLRKGEQSFTLAAGVLAAALVPIRQSRSVSLSVDPEQLDTFFDTVAKTVDVPVQEGRFRMENGRVVEFAESRIGRELDRAATAIALSRQLTSGETTVEIALKDTLPKFTSDSATTLGIKELVAQGKTNFTGSPPNRRFNIGVGAAKLNGLLIQPGEEFSLLKALGKIDGKNGFRQELVIKGDRTIPEFGGGLCQIGTTFFRLVLNAGLPIIERQNHSYRVRYYEPPVGMDATIYEPKPDFRFKNDYVTPLLLQARVEGDDLIFEFYGTKDGRQAVSSTPRVFNIKPPPKKKTIETTDLKPGEVKCVEKPHPGSDAEFTYTVTYADGQAKTQTFKSHYRPWGEVCLVGVKELKETKETNENANNAKETSP